MSTRLDGELVILNMARNNYVGLDEIGREVWDLLEAPRRVDELCREIGERFDGAPDEIARDVTAFLEELLVEELVQVVDARAR